MINVIQIQLKFFIILKAFFSNFVINVKQIQFDRKILSILKLFFFTKEKRKKKKKKKNCTNVESLGSVFEGQSFVDSCVWASARER